MCPFSPKRRSNRSLNNRNRFKPLSSSKSPRRKSEIAFLVKITVKNLFEKKLKYSL
jgi:hypothetical protein